MVGVSSRVPDAIRHGVELKKASIVEKGRTMAMLRNALIYFDQAIRDGSIRKAADTLHVASSAVNRQLLQLEMELGMELFIRLPRGIRPTAAGEAVLAYIRRSNRDSSTLRQDLARLKGGVHGTVRIAAAESLIEEIIPNAIRRLQEQYPFIDFLISSGDNYRIRADLIEKDCDVACAFDLPEISKIYTETSIRAKLGVICAPDHPIAQLSSVPLSECVAYPIIAPQAEWLAHSLLRELFNNKNLPLRVVARVERIGMLKQMVQAGVGIAFLAPIGLARDFEDGRLAWVPLSDRTIKATKVSIFTQRDKPQPIFVTSLIGLLKEELLAHAGG